MTTTLVTTESGTVYEFDNENSLVRRLPSNTEGLMRRDGEWLHLIYCESIEVGKPLIMGLEALGFGAIMTSRYTSPVVEIFDDSDSE